jgi:outer membrane lipoprotein-sorting protein
VHEFKSRNLRFKIWRRREKKMHRTRKVAIAVLFAALFWTPAPAQQINDANDILQKVRGTYRSLKSFQFEGVTASELQSTSMDSNTESPFQAAFVAPAKIHIEAKNPMMEVLFVSDGRTGWIYIPSTKTYSKFGLAGSSKLTSARTNEEELEALSGYSAGAGLNFDIFQIGILNRAKEARILREEPVELEGKAVDCYVVRVEYDYSRKEAKAEPAIRTYWIDENRFIVLREDWESREEVESDGVSGSMTLKASTILKKARLNESVPDQLFVFTPPAGAKEGKQP